MEAIGYVQMQHAERLGRPTKAYARWESRLPTEFRRNVLGQHEDPLIQTDHLIQRIKHYRSLMPMAMEARKPMFDLTSGDGAIGAHQSNVQQCRKDFERLCREIARRVGCRQGTAPQERAT